MQVLRKVTGRKMEWVRLPWRLSLGPPRCGGLCTATGGAKKGLQPHLAAHSVVLGQRSSLA